MSLRRKLTTAYRVLLTDPSEFLRLVKARLWEVLVLPIVLKRESKTAIEAVARSKKPGLFIDCGSNLGQGFEFFRRYFPPEYFDYELFEPNPNCVEVLRHRIQTLGFTNVNLNPKAVSDADKSMTLFGIGESGSEMYSQGGSLNPNHNKKFNNDSSERGIDVQAIDFSAFLKEKRKEYAKIYVKMDIEGAELDVLEKIIDDRNVDAIALMFVEFHSFYLDDHLRPQARERERRIIQGIRNSRAELHIWR